MVQNLNTIAVLTAYERLGDAMRGNGIKYDYMTAAAARLAGEKMIAAGKCVTYNINFKTL